MIVNLKYIGVVKKVIMLWLENNLCTQDQDQEVPEEP